MFYAIIIHGDHMEQIIEVIKYVLLGLVQGVTEIFPVSSSGHLAIFTHIFDMPQANFPLVLILTNTGSFLAIGLYFRQDVWQLIKGSASYLFKGNSATKLDFIYVLKLLVAVIPIGIVGLLLKDSLTNNLLMVGVSLLFTAGLLFFVYQQRFFKSDKPIGFRQAMIIGIFQMLAILPGVSRSGITMTGGLVQKINLKKVLKFSFLSYLIISFPVMLLGFFELHTLTDVPWFAFSLATVMSFIGSYFAVKLLYQYVKVKNLLYFAIYCVLVAGVALLLYFL